MTHVVPFAHSFESQQKRVHREPSPMQVNPPVHACVALHDPQAALGFLEGKHRKRTPSKAHTWSLPHPRPETGLHS